MLDTPARRCEYQGYHRKSDQLNISPRKDEANYLQITHSNIHPHISLWRFGRTIPMDMFTRIICCLDLRMFHYCSLSHNAGYSYLHSSQVLRGIPPHKVEWSYRNRSWVRLDILLHMTMLNYHHMFREFQDIDLHIF